MLLLQRVYPDGVPQATHLFAEGFVVSGACAGFSLAFFPEEAGLMTVALAAMTSIDTMERVIQWNTRQIYDCKVPPRQANRLLAGRLVSLFMGCTTAFFLLGLLLPSAPFSALFNHQVAGLDSSLISDWDFGSFFQIFGHNLYVLGFFFVVACFFRQGGVMLTVAWNATVWGGVFGWIAREWSIHADIGLLKAAGLAATIVIPHLGLEALAYSLSGIAGVFVGRALLKFALSQTVPWPSFNRSVFQTVFFSLIALMLAALYEGFLAPQVGRAIVAQLP